MPNRTPRIGLMGIMQELYDEMLPGITERQAGYLADVAAALADVAECVVEPPARNRDDIERVMREYERQGLDGVLIVILTYGPGQRVARALGQARLPLCLANIQPEPHVTAEWDMADMTYNQGDPRRAGHRERDGPRRRGVRRRHRGLAQRRLPRPRRALGARRGRGDGVAAAEGRPVRLRDERHGRHPLRRGGAAARARPERQRDRARASCIARRSR